MYVLNKYNKKEKRYGTTLIQKTLTFLQGFGMGVVV